MLHLVIIVGYEELKLIMQQMGLTKIMRRLIQFNRESIKDNIYATQASSMINIKLVYYRKAKS